MRNNIFIISAVCALLASSCGQDEMHNVTDGNGEMQLFTLTAAMPEEMTTRAVATDDEMATRCYVQIFNADGSELEGEESRVRKMNNDGNGKFYLDIRLSQDSKYDFLFWADNSTAPAPDNLRAVNYSADGSTIAFAEKLEDMNCVQQDNGLGMEVILNHVVTRVSVNSTAAVIIDENHKLTVSIPKCYTQYNVDVMQPLTEKTDFSYSNFVPITEATGGSMGHFYVLGDDDQMANSTVTLAYADQTKVMTNIPLKPDYHIMLKGDVALSIFDFSVDVDNNWGGNDKTDEIGDGYYIKDGVYYVFNASGLYAWAKAVEIDPFVSCTMVDDISMPPAGGSESNWTPLCWDENNGFSGVFDGGEYTITGLKLNDPDNDGIGSLFVFIGADGKVQNLRLKGLDVNAQSSSSIAMVNNGTIVNCTVSGNITSSAQCGGIVLQNSGNIIACSFNGYVGCEQLSGGIVAMHSGGGMTACYFNGTVSNPSASGIVDIIIPYSDNPTVTSCFWGGNAETGCRLDESENAVSNAEQMKKVNGTDITWTNAMETMNEALGNDLEGSKWMYVENTDAETKADMPLIIVQRK